MSEEQVFIQCTVGGPVRVYVKDGQIVRMRPIILTSITTIFGLSPMAFGLGGKSPLWAPMATAIIWGLGFATVLILSMIPAYYAILEDIGYLIRHRKRRKADTLREIEEAFEYKELQPYLKK